MKTCKRCQREYDEQVFVDNGPAQELGALFLEVTNPEIENDLCPDCREDAGILTLLGFGQ
ncbi:MAG: hypothetical protein COX51_03750 [Syntrophobacteraceae bacterium CG23_combo_of_CG06-09_8_20_14_all_50_8]|nr:MAG: hypothetical protein COX51_03750 [Syntrophobacteraceae bacterium CG23_combo_of_CG06-09_8_20_14_all_50_8]